MPLTRCAGSNLEPSIYLPRQRAGRCMVCRTTVEVVNGKVVEHHAADPFTLVDQRDYERLIFGQWPDRDDSI